MSQIFKNNAYGALAASVSAADTSVSLLDASRFPDPGVDHYLATLIGLDLNGRESAWEIVKVTAKAGNVLTVARGQESTVAHAWTPGTAIEMRLTAGALAALAGKPDEAPRDGRQYARKDGEWAEFGGAVAWVAYDERASLRVREGEWAVVDGLGLFRFELGSTEPDDDESCFATATGRWLLQAVHWDLIDAWQLPQAEQQAMKNALVDEVKIKVDALGSILRTSIVSAITSVAAVTQVSFAVAIDGAAVGDIAIASPPSPLSYVISTFARVTAPNVVTIYINNTSMSAQPIVVGTWSVIVFRG